MVHNGNHCF